MTEEVGGASPRQCGKNLVTMQVRSTAPCQNGSVVAMLHAVEKTFFVAQPIQLVALTSPVAY